MCRKTILSIIFLLTVFIGNGRAVECSFVSWTEIDTDGIYFRSDGEFQLLTLNRRVRSPLVEITPVEGRIVLYRKIFKEGEGENFIEAGRSNLLTTDGKILCFVSLGKNNSGINLMAVKDSFKDFPVGAFRIINGSPEPLGIALGDVKKVLQPKNMELFKPRIDSRGGFIVLTIVGKSGEVLQSRKIFSQAKERKILFISEASAANRKFNLDYISELILEE